MSNKVDPRERARQSKAAALEEVTQKLGLTPKEAAIVESRTSGLGQAAPTEGPEPKSMKDLAAYFRTALEEDGPPDEGKPLIEKMISILEGYDETKCFYRAEKDEPKFTLLGRDPCASYVVTLWAMMRAMMGSITQEEKDEALQIAEEMRTWAISKGKRNALTVATGMWRSAMKTLTEV